MKSAFFPRSARDPLSSSSKPARFFGGLASENLAVFKILMVGLLATQILSTIQVYLSDRDLHGKLLLLKNSGYLIVPNERVMPALKELAPAFFGGVFFTLSVGAGLSLLTLIHFWIWDRIFSRKAWGLVFVFLVWAGFLFASNFRGFSAMVTSYFLVVPLVVWGVALRWKPQRVRHWTHMILSWIPIPILALAWLSQLDRDMFVELRDSLFLSNAVGQRINAFYYKYTLYPAEAFKALDQKMLKTCHLEALSDGSALPMVESALLRFDYLSVEKSASASVDLQIASEGNWLVLQNGEKPVMRMAAKDLTANPKSSLSAFSAKIDRFAFFRHFTFYALLLGFPIALYVIFRGLLVILSGIFLNRTASSAASSAICLLVGIAMLFPLWTYRGERVDVKNLGKALGSEHPNERIAALRLVEQRKLEIGSFDAYKEMLSSRHVAERYWLARALGASRRSETFKDLLLLLDDSHRNVVSMAFYGLGKRGDKRAIRVIMKEMESSDDWYTQWYAYNALRSLGWTQRKSK